MAATTTLLAPNGRRYVVERGVVDDRSALAFTNGHCHSLALALHQATGGPIIAYKRYDGSFDHLFVKASDGRLIDIGGARDPSDLTPGGVLSFVDAADVDPLTASLGWVPPATDLAADWVSSVVERVERNEPHHRIGCFTYDFPLDDRLDIHIEWPELEGAVRLRGFGRLRAGTPSWARCSVMTIKADENGERLIDFAPAAFGVHARRFEALLRQSPDAVYANVLDPVEPEQPLAPPASA